MLAASAAARAPPSAPASTANAAGQSTESHKHQREGRGTGQLADHQHRSVRSGSGAAQRSASRPGRPRHPPRYASLIGAGGRLVKMMIEVLLARKRLVLLHSEVNICASLLRRRYQPVHPEVEHRPPRAAASQGRPCAGGIGQRPGRVDHDQPGAGHAAAGRVGAQGQLEPELAGDAGGPSAPSSAPRSASRSITGYQSRNTPVAKRRCARASAATTAS